MNEPELRDPLGGYQQNWPLQLGLTAQSLQLHSILKVKVMLKLKRELDFKKRNRGGRMFTQK